MSAPATARPAVVPPAAAPTPLDANTNVYRSTIQRYRARRELWGTCSLDGQWTYQRVEIPGTPWDLTHRPTGRTRYGFTTLRQARICTADGSALAELDARAAAPQDKLYRGPACAR